MTDSKPSFRLTDDEIWEFVANAHTGIMTTLRRDGMPIAMPLWFACIDRTIYVHTRGKKLQRITRDARASFLVESGEMWAELKAVHLTGHAELVELAPKFEARIMAETARKYDAFRAAPAQMPERTAALYAAMMRWVRFTPEARILSWDNAKLTATPEPT
jgi:nitroimidazol reductase NimA-like FMN-containing flavoprotein (pyridoxamine 5'-phosphate oxidase superfamily)